jgi:thioredoxin reductase (NADPH)
VSDTAVRNVIIIGSGPAGYTAAVYAARAQLEPLVFEGSVTAGGALMTTTEVENYPGFAQGIMGPNLMSEMRDQAERFGAELVPDDIVSVDLTGDIKSVTDSAGTVHRAKTVILAMGSGYRKLGLPNEEVLSGRGVSWCATCDGFFFKQHEIAVVGGGDTAIEEATFLTRFADKVTIVHRRDELRASKIMADRAFANDKIEFAWNSAVSEIQGDGKLIGVQLTDTVTGEKRDLPVTGLFIAIGHDPCWSGRAPPRPTCRACSRPATWSTTPTARPSPRPAPVVPRPWTPSASWPRWSSRRATVTPPRPRRPPSPSLSDLHHLEYQPLKEFAVGEKMNAVTDAEFDQTVLKSDKPVLVDFWAEWCGPCRQVSPILEELAQDHSDKLTFLKMNVDENPVTPSNYRVTGIPTINVYVNGELAKSIVGAKPKAALLKELAAFTE